MKRIACLLLSLAVLQITIGQNTPGTIVTKIINSVYLKNTGGENPNRRISIYLPPGYDHSTKHYPVIYYLHGFLNTDSITPDMKNVLDLAIAKNKIRPYILVIAIIILYSRAAFIVIRHSLETGQILRRKN
jgi:predicted alpha/beta superfamily hydrolase